MHKMANFVSSPNFNFVIYVAISKGPHVADWRLTLLPYIHTQEIFKHFKNWQFKGLYFIYLVTTTDCRNIKLKVRTLPML